MVCLWFQMVHYLPAQRAITGCRHVRGKLVPSVPGVGGRMTALVWHCDACPFQVPLKLGRVGRAWLLLDEVKEVGDAEGRDTLPGSRED